MEYPTNHLAIGVLGKTIINFDFVVKKNKQK